MASNADRGPLAVAYGYHVDLAVALKPLPPLLDLVQCRPNGDALVQSLCVSRNTLAAQVSLWGKHGQARFRCIACGAANPAASANTRDPCLVLTLVIEWKASSYTSLCKGR